MNTSLVEQRQILRRNIIFNYIRKNNGQLSRNDLAKLTGYSMTTVAALVNSLFRENLIYETASIDSRVGRRPVLLSVNPAGIYFAGIDCTISHINVTVINSLEEVVYEHSLPVNITDAETMLNSIENSINFFRKKKADMWSSLANITIGLPGKTDTQTGLGISFISIKDWHNVDVMGFLTSRFDKHFYILNNIDAMVIGYQSSSNIDSKSITLFVLLRRGVGMKLYAKGSLMSEYGVLCEFGHLKARDSNRLCSCGKRGCYDTEVSQPGILNKLREAASVHPFSELGTQFEGSNEEITFEHFLDLIRAGNNETIEIFNETAVHIGELLATALLILSPDRVVLSSEMCRLEDLFKQTVERVLNRELPITYPVSKPQIEYILPNQYLCSKGAAIAGLQQKFFINTDVS